ncbi:hypothetical protein BEN74_12520 [Acinetobacter sp. WCHAc010034]|nr:hypothetical protein BEN74_12520 [Acinetobacter sp. WCHAc010034]
MQFRQALAAFFLIFCALFSSLSHAQPAEGAYLPALAVFALSLIVLAVLAVYVTIKIRRALRNDLDKHIDKPAK